MEEFRALRTYQLWKPTGDILKLNLKIHSAKEGRRLNQVAKSKFGYDLTDFRKALLGDKKLIQAIGEAARQGRYAQDFAPLLEDAYLDIIRGTESLNKSEANILKQSGSSAIAIGRATLGVIGANEKYNNTRQELIAELLSSKSLEKQRHQYAVNYIRLKAYMELYLGTVENEAKLIEQSNRPEIKQIAEDERYQMNLSRHLLENGSSARPDLLPHKQYLVEENSTVRAKSLGGRIKGVLSALGL